MQSKKFEKEDTNIEQNWVENDVNIALEQSGGTKNTVEGFQSRLRTCHEKKKP